MARKRIYLAVRALQKCMHQLESFVLQRDMSRLEEAHAKLNKLHVSLGCVRFVAVEGVKRHELT